MTSPATASSGAAAFFDVDKTLVPQSTAMALVGSFRREGLISNRTVARMLVANITYVLRGTDDERLARWTEASMALIAGWERATVQRIVADGLDGVLLPLVYGEAMERIAAHTAAGDRVYAISATMEDVIAPLAESLGLSAIASEVVTGPDGRYTGQIAFACWGENKARRIRALAADEGLDLARSAAYSDSISDLPMLELVGHPHAVNPDAALAREAQRRGWPILRFVHPTRRPTRRRLGMGRRGQGLALAGVVAGIVGAWLARARRV